MAEKIDRTWRLREEEITCPWCDYEYSESILEFDDYGEEDKDMECESCGKKFNAKKEISVSFSTDRIEDEDNPGEVKPEAANA